jgi:hypothetical protein
VRLPFRHTGAKLPGKIKRKGAKKQRCKRACHRLDMRRPDANQLLLLEQELEEIEID